MLNEQRKGLPKRQLVSAGVEIWLAIDTPTTEPVDVALDASPEATIGELLAATASHLGVAPGAATALHHRRLERLLDPSETVGGCGLRHGDRLTVAPATWSPPAAERAVRTGASVVTLSVVGGPVTGRRFSLGPGDHVVGRSAQCDITLDDPTLSRQHVRITVTDTLLEVTDAGSSNGTFIDGARVSGATTLQIGTVIEAGHTLLRIDEFIPTDARESKVENGYIRFNRPPRVLRPRPTVELKISAPPAAPGKRKLPMVTAFGPMIVGIPMVAISAISGNTLFLVMGLATLVSSPLLAFASWWEDKRSGRSDHRSATEAFQRDLTATQAALDAAVAEEVDDRRRRAPDAADLLDRARLHRPNLWERRADDDDFLHVAVGWADQTADVAVEIASGGDNAERSRAEEALKNHRVARNVPVVVELTAGALGLCGDRESSAAATRWIMLQLTTLHSPRDVVIAAALSEAEYDDWSWLAWLPHLHSDTSPVSGSHLAVGDTDAAGLFEALNGVVRSRHSDGGVASRSDARPNPSVVVLISDAIRVPRTALNRLLEAGPAAGVYVIWLGSHPDSLPGECKVVVQTVARPPSLTLTVPSTGVRLASTVLDAIDVPTLRSAARSLAPVKDVTASSARGQIPNAVNLLDLLDLDEPTAARVADRWRAGSVGVNAPVGLSPAGEFVLDMRLDGPHALVGGTTGAGKSELLQTFVAALAATHPPDRVTFLLIDYKGGAAFKDCVDLPHTVGMVTDLDGHLVHRALVSLNAELRRREHLLRDFGAKDLLEMERRFTADAPPALVLIVDEFATLAKELPDFVDGVVNVAQRGRSLGIHLILATQRPAGAINDNVRANTNLRIALRMNDQADSQDVINSREAALLPRTLPGRAFVRTGESELTEVQVAYVGGHTSTVDAGGDRLALHPIDRGRVVRPRRAQAAVVEAPTDLQVLVSAVREAAVAEGIPAPARPWVEPLPTLIPLAALGREAHRPGKALLGVVDVPAEQTQRPLWFDLEAEGNLLVYGASGAGKTTMLRSMAASLALAHHPDSLHLYALDFASRGLTALEPLPHVGAVVSGDDIERVQRLLSMIEREVAHRRTRFAERGVSSLAEYRAAAPDDSMPTIVVLLDGYGGFTSVFESIDFGAWVEQLPRLAADGRPLGIHWVISADRRMSVGLSLSSAVRGKVVLRMVDDDDYASLGLDGRETRGAVLPPGRGFVAPALELQVPVLGDDASGAAQVAAIEELSRLLPRPSDARGPRAVTGLPSDLARSALPQAARLAAVVGVRQLDLGPLELSLHDGNIFVASPNRGGKSTALVTIVQSLAGSTPDAQFVLLAPRRSPLSALDIWQQSATRVADCDDLATELQSRLDDRDGTEPPVVIVVDDATELTDSMADSALELLARRGKDLGIFVVGAAESTLARRAYGGVVSELRRDRNGLILLPDPDLDGDLLNVRVPRARPGFWRAGRGVAVSNGAEQIVQVAGSD